MRFFETRPIRLIPLLSLTLGLTLVTPSHAQCCKEGKKALPMNQETARVSPAKAGGTISTGGLLALTRSKAPFTLIDARTKPEKTIPGARPAKDLCFTCKSSLAKQVGAKERLIVTFSAGPKCIASSQVATKLRQKGYKNVLEYKAGAAAYHRSQQPAGKICPQNKEACTQDSSCCGKCPDQTRTPLPAVVNTAGLRTLLEAKIPLVLIDARQGKVKQSSRLPGAIAISPADFSRRTDQLKKVARNKNQLVLTYCAGPTCSASNKLAAKLRQAGYTNVIEYPDGLAGWQGSTPARPKNTNNGGKKPASSCCGSCGGSCPQK